MRAVNLTRDATLASEVEVGASLWAKFWGLMGRPSLPPGHALWLPESNGIHMFLMRFPMDAVFLGRLGADHAGPVVAAHSYLRPWLGMVPLVLGAHGVLELPAGTIAATGTTVGDRVHLG